MKKFIPGVLIDNLLPPKNRHLDWDNRVERTSQDFIKPDVPSVEAIHSPEHDCPLEPVDPEEFLRIYDDVERDAFNLSVPYIAALSLSDPQCEEESPSDADVSAHSADRGSGTGDDHEGALLSALHESYNAAYSVRAPTTSSKQLQSDRIPPLTQ